MQVSSSGFENNKTIEKRFTFKHSNVNPPFDFENIPEGTKSLAVVMDGLDQPTGSWTYWVAFNIPVSDRIEENCTNGSQGINDFGVRYYIGPLTTEKPHRYHFKFYALDSFLDLKNGVNKKALEKKMEKHLLAKAEMVGLFDRSEEEDSKESLGQENDGRVRPDYANRHRDESLAGDGSRQSKPWYYAISTLNRLYMPGK